MSIDPQLLILELRRLRDEARIQSKSQSPGLALLRISEALGSLLISLEQKPLSQCPLSQRETEVLEAVALGYTNREIAQALSLSEKTIEYHLKSIFHKTQASTRTEAVKNAMDSNWLKRG